MTIVLSKPATREMHNQRKQTEQNKESHQETERADPTHQKNQSHALWSNQSLCHFVENK